MENKLLQKLWEAKDFTPTGDQEKAILFDENKPMFITAAPGSGKTRVLLWRTVYLIVEKGIAPDQIFLSTFTEKAAHQLKEGLKELLGLASNFTNQKYDLARMYVGTIHSNCHRIIIDRNFSSANERQASPRILDELGQYLYIYNRRFWTAMIESVGLEDSPDTNQMINAYLGTPQQARARARHVAAINVIRLFNRLSGRACRARKIKIKQRSIESIVPNVCLLRQFVGS